MNLPNPLGSALLLLAIAVSITIWMRMGRKDSRLPMIYLLGLLGGFLGAKLGFIFAEGWTWYATPYFWVQILNGKTILGALLGGYFFVEFAKRQTGYTAPTGDLFAITAPIGIIIGRLGCLTSGCCLGNACEPNWYALTDAQGTPRWPAVPVEIAFNLMAVAVFLALRRSRVLPGQHFHLYLMAYGAFRFLHEFVRNTPHLAGPFSGYHLLALGLMLLGLGRFLRRQGRPATPPR